MKNDSANGEAFLIPIDEKIKEFKIHLDSHPRTIFIIKKTMISYYYVLATYTP